MKTCYYCKGPLRRRRIEHMHEWGGEERAGRGLRSVWGSIPYTGYTERNRPACQ